MQTAMDLICSGTTARARFLHGELDNACAEPLRVVYICKAVEVGMTGLALVVLIIAVFAAGVSVGRWSKE